LTTVQSNKVKGKESSWRDFFEIQDIKNGILCLDLRRYRRFVEITTIPLSHCSSDELENIFLGWKAFCHSVDTQNLGIYIQSRQVDLEARKKEEDRNRKLVVEKYDGNEKLDQWLFQGQKFDEDLLESKDLPLRRNFFVFMEEGTEKDPEEDLKRVAERFEDRIDATAPFIKLFARDIQVLDTSGVLDVLHAWSSKSTSKFINGSTFHEQGFFHKWVSGVAVGEEF